MSHTSMSTDTCECLECILFRSDMAAQAKKKKVSYKLILCPECQASLTIIDLEAGFCTQCKRMV